MFLDYIISERKREGEKNKKFQSYTVWTADHMKYELVREDVESAGLGFGGCRLNSLSLLQTSCVAWNKLHYWLSVLVSDTRGVKLMSPFSCPLSPFSAWRCSSEKGLQSFP